jgi:Ca2+-binding RTX toxin-like protein
MTYPPEVDGLLGTGTSYQLKELDVGKKIQLTATYIDGHGSAESVSYEATQPVANVNEAAQGSVWIDWTPRENSYINGRWDNISDDDGVGAIKFEWRADGKLVGTENSLFLTESMVEKKITFSLIFIDGHGTQETLTSKPSAPVINENQLVQGYVRINGEPTLGNTLSIEYKVTDVDGLGPVTFEWRADGDRIVGYGQSLLLDNSVLWNNLRAYVRYVDGHGSDEWLSVQTYRNVVPTNVSPIGDVVITGNLIQGAVLKATHNLTDADGMGAVEYKWYADQIRIGGAFDSELILTADLVGKSITAEVNYRDNHNCEEQVRSKDTKAIANLNDLPTGTVYISGVPTQGQTLTAFNSLKDEDGLGVISYQWSSNGNALIGATTDKLVLTESHVGKLISVTASYKDLLGANESVIGSISNPVANQNDLPTGSVSLAGDFVVGQTLQIKSNLTDADGLGAFSYQWKADGVEIAGASQSAYQLTSKEIGKQITAQIFYIDGHGTSEKISTQGGNFVRELILGSNNLNDVLKGQNSIYQLQGMDGNDTLFGGSGQDLLMGGLGDDELSGGLGTDILDGAEGYDRALYGKSGNSVAMNLDFRWVLENYSNGGLNSVRDEFGQFDQWLSIEAVHVIGSTQGDNLQLSMGNDIASGEEGDDYIVSWAGNDLIFGNAGNDHIRPGSGRDTVDGGEGWDHVDYYEEVIDLPELGGYGVLVDLSKRMAIDSWGFTDSLVNIESVSASQYNDELIGDELRNWLGGQAGDDLINGMDGDDMLEGHDGNDTMVGGKGNDWFRGGPGNDEIYGDEDSDYVDYWGEIGSPSEFGKKGVFVDLSSNTAIDNWGFLDNIVGVENVIGSSFADVIIGNKDNNHLMGGAGNDSIDGNAGDDNLRGESGNDTLNGGDGYDWIDNWFDINSPEALNYKGIEANLTNGKVIDIYGNEDTIISIEGVHGTNLSDKIIGNAADNTFYGNDGHDSLLGMGGVDNLHGGNGNDTLSGGGGSDYLNGGAGQDRAVYSLSVQSYKVFRNNDGSWNVNFSGSTSATPFPERDGNDRLDNIERLVFSDQIIALDLEGNVGTVAKILGAVFGRDFVKNPYFVGIGIEYLENRGYNYESLLGLAITERLGANPTNRQVVDLLYTNVVGVAPTAQEAAPFVKMLEDKSYTVTSLAQMAADTTLNMDAINLTGLAYTGLPYLEFHS